jgi:hypothetical protein
LHSDLIVQDHSIVAPDPGGHSRIDWNAWHGEKVIYRTVTPGHIAWTQLPEVVVLLEPMIGERIIYNPFGGSIHPRTEAETRQRIQSLWQELYGREPEAILRTFAFQPTISACANRLRAKGFTPQKSSEVLDLLGKLLPTEQDSSLMGVLLHLTPFGLQGEPAPGSAEPPFLLIHDRSLFQHAGGERLRLDPARWARGTATFALRDRNVDHVGGSPVVIYTTVLATTGPEVRDMLARSNIFDSLDQPQLPPYISWNYMLELTVSQGMHVSTQPFLLREYARHVAALWEKEYGRRPEVNAATAVSFNGRPFQALVDPHADLASVPLTWLRHNPWINDLETPRIPGGTISPDPPRAGS